MQIISDTHKALINTSRLQHSVVVTMVLVVMVVACCENKTFVYQDYLKINDEKRYEIIK